MASIDDVYKLCSEIKADVASINSRCVEREKVIHGHHITLYGSDGSKGIVAKINQINGVEKSKREWVKSILSPIIAAIVVAIIMSAVYLWGIHFKGSNNESEKRFEKLSNDVSGNSGRCDDHNTADNEFN